MAETSFWTWLVDSGFISGDPTYYSDGRASADEYVHAFDVAWKAISGSGDQAAKDKFWSDMVAQGYIEGNPAYYSGGSAQPDEYTHAFDVAGSAAGDQADVLQRSGSGDVLSSGGQAPADDPNAVGWLDGGQGDFWQWAVDQGLIRGDPTYYSGQRAQSGEYAHAIQAAFNASAPGSALREELVQRLIAMGAIEGNPAYWVSATEASVGEDWANLANAAESFFGGDTAQTDTEKSAQIAEIIDAVIPPVQRVGTETIKGTVIPAGMRLIQVTNPVGSDAGEHFYLVGDVYGVSLAYEIGGRDDLTAMFGAAAEFPRVETMTQKQFDGSDMQMVGHVDEIVGTSESLQAQFDRDMRSAGFEAPPQWLLDSKSAMMKYVVSMNEGWSYERMWTALSTESAFKERFAGLDVVMGQMSTTSWVAGIAEYTAREGAIRLAILSSRGPGADTSQPYVSSLIASGWQPAEVGQLLALEKRVKANPAALDNINTILAFQGLDVLDPDDFVSFLQDQDAMTIDPSYAPGQVFEAVNDALRWQALIEVGLDIDVGFAAALGEGTSGAIAAAGFYSERARFAAMEVARNANELDLAKYGLERDDIVAATFGEESPSGKTTVEVNELLEKMGRERSKAATGFAASSSYVDALGRLRVQGFSGL